MPTIPIFFLDRDGQRTDDTVIGTPNVNVSITIGDQEVICAQPAIVDIGADVCFLSLEQLASIGDIIKARFTTRVLSPSTVLTNLRERILPQRRCGREY
jgi:hypothetical protein